MNRRAFLAGLTATAAGLMIPERKVWALDRTMITPVNHDLDAFGTHHGTFSYLKTPYTKIYAGFDPAGVDGDGAAVVMAQDERGIYHVLHVGDPINGPVKIEIPIRDGSYSEWVARPEVWG